MNIEQIPSPNRTKGRWLQKPSRIVFHWIVGRVDTAIAEFQKSKNNPNPKSAHFVVGPTRIVQMVDLNDTAWHAGDWWENLHSVGLETEGGPNIPIEDGTYENVSWVYAYVCKQLGWGAPAPSRQKKHSEVKATQCPGTLDMNRVMERARVIYGEMMRPDQGWQPLPVIDAITSTPTPPAPAPKYVFNTNLQPGQKGEEVGKLQDRLVELGYMNANDLKSGGRTNYGPKTTRAVVDFQLRQSILPGAASYGAGYFGPKTRDKLNNL